MNHFEKCFRFLVIINLVSASLSFMGCTKREELKEQSSSSEQTVTTREPTREPEKVLKSFMLAMMTSNKDGVEAEILPHPNSSVLWSGAPLTDQIRQQVAVQIDTLTMIEFKSGETIHLPGNKNLIVTSEMANSSNKIIVAKMGGQVLPTPFPMRLSNGQWKLDASSLIQSRLAARSPRPKAN
jgi:hypothetical protein